MPSVRLAICAFILTLGLSLSVASAAEAPKIVKLSNETTLSHSANPNDRAVLRAAPDSGARTVGRLRLETEDGLPEVYLVLRQATEPGGVVWYQVRIPGRPNGRTGWAREESLGPLHTLRTQLVVSRRTLRATLYRNGHRILRLPVGVGKGSTPTPGGRFWIRERLVLRGGHGAYGPLAFGTSAYSNKLTDWPKGGVVGIHGTDEPQLIPGRPSHGCIRMRNKDILHLARLMPVGTPVLIQ